MFLKKVFEKFTSTQDDNVDPAEEAFRSYNLRVTGIILLIFGSFLHLVDSTIFGLAFTFIPGFDAADDGTLNLSGIRKDAIDEAGDEAEPSKTALIPSVLSGIIIFTGIVLVLHSYVNTKAQVNMVVCPLFYTFSFMFLTVFIQNVNDKDAYRKTYFGLFLVFLIIAIAVQTSHNNTAEEVAQILAPTTPSTTPTTQPSDSS